MSGPFRLAPMLEPVRMTLDGKAFTAEKGEPLAAALIAAGTLTLARSPKFHRPRGVACMRAACDGCLARVDDAPNVMTCMVGAAEGTAITSQNTLGSRDIDLLRMTDWFFPDGMNHHELFAGVPGVQPVMQVFARRVAGLGRLPSAGLAPRPARRRLADVLVVGSGPAGMAVAAAAAAAGRAVEVLDDALVPGGCLRALGAAEAWSDVRGPFDAAVESGAVRLRTSTTAGGVYGDDVLIVGPDGAEIVEARAVVLATGAHDGVLPFEGNDVPGVLSARAGCFLLAHGVAVGRRVAIAVPEGGGPFGVSFAQQARHVLDVSLVHQGPVAVKGTSRVKGAVFADRTLSADALLVDAPRAPAYELCEQAGARIVHEPRGFLPVAPGGRIRDGFFAAGEVVGTRLEPAAMLDEARQLVPHL